MTETGSAEARAGWILGREEIRAYLGGIGTRAFYGLVHEGLPVSRLDRRWIGNAQELDAWMCERGVRQRGVGDD